MTEQVPDAITVDGRQWIVTDGGDNLREFPPSDKELGIRPISTSTANWRGRIDHYIVFCERLFLHKVEVNQMVDAWKYLPPGARREERTIFTQWERHDREGMRIVERPERSYFYVYDDLLIPFSGTISGVWPYENWWDFPMAGQYDIEEVLAPEKEIFLEFSDGAVTDMEIRSLPGNRSNDRWKALVALADELKRRGPKST